MDDWIPAPDPAFDLRDAQARTSAAAKGSDVDIPSDPGWRTGMIHDLERALNDGELDPELAGAPPAIRWALLITRVKSILMAAEDLADETSQWGQMPNVTAKAAALYATLRGTDVN